jgi:hypothetical protein
MGSSLTAPDADAVREIDACLPSALRDLRLARNAMDLSPSGAASDRLERAQAALNRLLDQRLEIRRPE